MLLDDARSVWRDEGSWELIPGGGSKDVLSFTL